MCSHKTLVNTLRKKGIKALTGAVPFQKGKLLSILGANMDINVLICTFKVVKWTFRC